MKQRAARIAAVFAVVAAAAAVVAFADVFPKSPKNFSDRGNDEGNVFITASSVRRSPRMVGLADFTSAGANLPESRRDAASAIVNGQLYVIGGTNLSGSPTTTVYRAPITGGIVGQFTPTGSLFTARSGASVTVYEGTIYVVGGQTTASGEVTATVEHAAPQADGTVFWTGGSPVPLSAARKHAGLAASAGRLWLLGGEDGAGARADIYTTNVRGDGSLGAWVASGNLPTVRTRAGAFADDSVVYLVGGRNTGGATSSVTYGRVVSGTIPSWLTTTPLPALLERHAVIAQHGHVYSMGGINGAGTTENTIWRAPILGSGGVGDWLVAASVSGSTTAGMAAASDGRHIFLAGGGDAAGPTASVRAASLDMTGNFSPWTGNQPMPNAIDSASALAFEGHSILLGGRSSNSTPPTSLRTPLVGAEVLGAWTTTPGAPTTSRELAAAVVVQGAAVWLGGKIGGVASNLVEAAAILPTGFGPWASRSGLLTARHSHAAVTSGGRIYVFGGHDGTNPLSSVEVHTYDRATVTTPSFTAALSSAREGLGAAAQGRFIYLTGGRTNATTYVNTVEIATVQGNGTLTYATSAPLPDARAFHGTAIAEGYLYVIGGLVGANTTADNYRARIAADGSLEAWRPMRPMLAGRSHFGLVVTNWGLQIIGGRDAAGASLASVFGGPINGHGMVRSWTQQTTTVTAVFNHAVAAMGNNLFVLGGSGSNGASRASVFRASVNDGVVGAWADSGQNLLAASEGLTAFVNGPYLYAVGGNATGRTTKVSRIRFDASSGTFTPPWLDATGTNESLADSRVYHSLASYNGYLYVIGGQLGSGAISNVLYAQLPASSSTAYPVWNQAAFSLPVDIAKGCAVAYNGYLYVVGGRVGGSAASATVYVAPLSPTNGNLTGAFTQTEPMLAARKSHSCVARDGYLYVVGGDDPALPARFFSAAEMAPILPNGELGKFTALGSPVDTVSQGALILQGDHLHLIGGQSAAGANNALGTVHSMKLLTPAARGVYSTVIDLGFQASSVSGVTLAGSTSARGRVTQLDYAVAGWSANYFAANAILNPQLNALTPFTHSNVRFVSLRTILDDRFSATTDPTATRDLSDLRVDYTPLHRLKFMTPTHTVAATACSPAVTVQVEDASGVPTAFGASTTVQLKTSSASLSFFFDANCTLENTGQDLIFAANDTSKTFHFRDLNPGTPWLYALGGPISLEPTQQQHTLTSGQPSRLAITTAVQTVNAGSCSSEVRVQLQTARGAAINAASEVPLAIAPIAGVNLFSDSSCSTPLTSPKINAGASVMNFHFKGTAAGAKDFNVSVAPGADASSLSPASQLNTIKALDPSKFAFTTGAHTVSSGTCSPAITVELQDSYGNRSNPPAPMSATLSSDAGTLQLFLDSACNNASQTLSFGFGEFQKSFHFKDTIGGAKVVSVALGAFVDAQTHTVTAGTASNFTLTTASTTVTAGVPFDLTVSAYDGFGNPATGYAGTVSFSSSDPTAALPANGAMTGASKTFSAGAKLKMPGAQDITVTDGVIQKTLSLTVEPGPVTSFQVTGFPSPVTAGETKAFTVEALDGVGNVAKNFTGTVSFRSSDAKATLPASRTFTAADQGVEQFTASFATAGVHELEVFEGTVTGKQTGITVVPAAPSKAIIAAPATADVGKTASISVRATDAFDNALSAQVKLQVTGGATITSASFDAAPQPQLATGTVKADGSSTATLAITRPEKIVVCAELGESKPCVDISPRLALPDGQSVAAVSLGVDEVVPGAKFNAKVTVSAPADFDLPSGLALKLTFEGVKAGVPVSGGTPLAQNGEALSLPSVAAKGTLSIDVPVEVLASATKVGLTAVIQSADGTDLTNPVSDEAEVKKLGVDVGGVGCGCNATSSALPLLALAAALLLRSRRRPQP